MATTDVNDAYRNERVDPDEAYNFCYIVDDLVVIDVRLTFGWTGSLGNFGVRPPQQNTHTVTLTSATSSCYQKGKI